MQYFDTRFYVWWLKPQNGLGAVHPFALANKFTGWQFHKVSLRTLQRRMAEGHNSESAQADFVTLPAREFIRQGSSGLKSPRLPTRHMRLTVLITVLFALALFSPPPAHAQGNADVQCANLVYAVNKSSVCYSDRFLERLQLETNIHTATNFVKVKLDSSDLYQYPFSIMTGEGGFTLTPQERTQLRYYVTHGGFLLASSGCSDPEWTRSFRNEMNIIFPKQKMQPIPLTHAIFHTVYTITNVQTTHEAHTAQLEGLTVNGKIVVLFSSDGLNDTAHAQNCCCCGGDEIGEAERINVDILAYALLH